MESEDLAQKPRPARGFRSGSNPLRHGFAVPPLPKGRGFGRGVKFCVYKLASSSRWLVRTRLALFAKGST